MSPPYCLCVLSLLRQPRYLGLIAVCVLIAAACAMAGAWQVLRFDEKHRANHELRTNNRDVTVDVSQALGPASAPTSDGRAQEFRHVTATGTYLTASETLLRGQAVDNSAAYLVVTPLQTDQGILLVGRGLVAQTAAATQTPTVPTAPSGRVTVTVRLEPASASSDRYGQLPRNQIDHVNATQQAARLGQPVWNAYGELLDGQPGVAGLSVVPDPDMSNPAGGAEEPQHAAYVVQWFIFGAGALFIPFVMARNELRRGKPTKRSALDDRLAGNG